jgi:hypothetical protein
MWMSNRVLFYFFCDVLCFCNSVVLIVYYPEHVKEFRSNLFGFLICCNRWSLYMIACGSVGVTVRANVGAPYPYCPIAAMLKLSPSVLNNVTRYFFFKRRIFWTTTILDCSATEVLSIVSPHTVRPDNRQLARMFRNGLSSVIEFFQSDLFMVDLLARTSNQISTP